MSTCSSCTGKLQSFSSPPLSTLAVIHRWYKRAIYRRGVPAFPAVLFWLARAEMSVSNLVESTRLLARVQGEAGSESTVGKAAMPWWCSSFISAKDITVTTRQSKYEPEMSMNLIAWYEFKCNNSILCKLSIFFANSSYRLKYWVFIFLTFRT